MLSNMWWYPDHIQRVERVLPLVSELMVSIHPESKQTRSEMWKAVSQISRKFNIRTNIWEQRTFSLPAFTDVPNGRKNCAIAGCHVLRPDGMLGRCPIMVLQPTGTASTQFDMMRTQSHFNPFTGTEAQLALWLKGLVPCCQFCNYGRSSVPHYTK